MPGSGDECWVCLMSGLSSFLQSVSSSVFGEFPTSICYPLSFAKSHKGFVEILFIRKCFFHKKLKFLPLLSKKNGPKGAKKPLGFWVLMFMPALNHAVHAGTRDAKLILNYVGTVVSC